MIDILITGHGNFADGIYSSAKLIAGEKENLVCINFLEGDSTDELADKISKAYEKMGDKIIVFSDLAGGSPFKTAVTESLKYGNKQIKVLGGSNMPMLLECLLMREFVEEFDEFVEKILNTGKEAIVKFEMVQRRQEEPSDGI